MDFEKVQNRRDVISFIINNFKFEKVGRSQNLLTGYYEPIIKVSRKRNHKYKYPILKKSKNYDGLSREQIEKNFDPKDVLIWTDDLIDLFFLHIQGSGVGKFENKEEINISYNGNNGMAYSSIGKYLIKNKFLKKNTVNLFTIKQWLKDNPDLSRRIMNKNKRFIFFKENHSGLNSQPIGALGLKLNPNVSIAVDKNIYPLGLPFIVNEIKNFSAFPVVSLDTGAAIIGANRADLFTGRGQNAEKKAGMLKKQIYLYALIPYIR